MFQSQPRSGQGRVVRISAPYFAFTAPRRLVTEYSVIGGFRDIEGKYEIQQPVQQGKRKENMMSPEPTSRDNLSWDL
jgi:hypothetical protein